MGKSGAALRAAKQKNTTYTFTREQLHEHDRLVIEEFRQRVVQDVYENAQKKMDAEWEKRAAAMDIAIKQEWDSRARQFASENPVDNFYEFMSCLLSISVRVLIEKFRWKPLPKEGKYDRRLRIVKFSDCVAAEIDRIAGDEMLDIRKYSEEVYELYGLRFGTQEDGEDDG